MVPTVIQKSLATSLGLQVKGFKYLSGGCINEAGKITTSRGNYFIKWNGKDRCPGMLEKEGIGLEALSKTKTVPLPEVVAAGEAGEWQYLVLEYIEPGALTPSSWEGLGSGLAQLHGHHQPSFGLGYDNYIGSLTQSNKEHGTWAGFFEHERIRPLLEKLVQAKRIGHDMLGPFDRMFARMGGIFPEGAPSLLHGDLWGGNVIGSRRGVAMVIDPAVYFGHREAEIAFTMLFGAFEKPFYEAYHHLLPLESGFEERKDLYNLYPLLVHAILFGDSYLGQVKCIIKHFT